MCSVLLILKCQYDLPYGAESPNKGAKIMINWYLGTKMFSMIV